MIGQGSSIQKIEPSTFPSRPFEIPHQSMGCQLVGIYDECWMYAMAKDKQGRDEAPQ